MHDVVRDTWKDRRDDQPRVDTRLHELAQRPEPRRRNGRARFELSGQCRVVRDQRDMDLELVPLLQAHEQIAVARDQRALGDDAKGKTFTARQALQHRAGDPKAAFSGLVGIRRRADYDAVAEWHVLEIGVKRGDHLFFDEDPRFERLPPVGAAVIGELGVGELAGVVRALDDVAMRVARIAVTAAEFAADVGIERPILHPRCGGLVEDALGCERNEPGATEALVEDGVGQSDGLTVGLQEGDLFSHNAPSRTGGTPSSRTGARSWCHNRDTEEAFEAASLGAPGVLLQPYDPEYNPKPARRPSASRRSRPARQAARGSDPGMRRCG